MKKLLTVVAAFALALGISFSGPAQEAQAAPKCKYGWICIWEGVSASGRHHVYSHSANHSHPIGSLYFNYATWGTRFWTRADGKGDVITYYHIGDRGFRNWDPYNWYRCRSHKDIKG